jgi:DGQHR domain-containing protein
LATKPKKRKKRKAKKKLSPAELKQLRGQQRHRSDVRSIFRLAGFQRVPIAGKAFRFMGTEGEFDDAQLLENVLVLCEYTTSQESDVSTHLKKKKVLYDKIAANRTSFVAFLDETFPAFRRIRKSDYSDGHFRVVILYCSLRNVKPSLKSDVPGVKYGDYRIIRYFKSVASSIRQSAKYELLHFLGVPFEEFSEQIYLSSTTPAVPYGGSVLPEEHSNFGKGYKVVSFYIDPDAILKRAYVLRRDGWADDESVYQRMISRTKIDSIRRYLLEKKRVFINNIVVTLSPDTKILNERGNTIDIQKIEKTMPVTIALPAVFNSIGIVDGQHRVFSYYEGGRHEQRISKLRRQQNLLVTGVIFPPHIKPLDRTRFEATLFLEINTNQTTARSDLKQAIGMLLTPYSSESIAKRVLNNLNDEHGPLFDTFERYFFDKGKMKTTSVVSYGLKPLVKLQGPDSLYSVWHKAGKTKLQEETDGELLLEYVDFCAKEVNLFFGAVRATLPDKGWTPDKDVKGRFLSTTSVNGLIICLRKIVENRGARSFDVYKKRLEGLPHFQFGKYKSSQYTRMGSDLFEKFFA